ncbi:Tryptophan aminotransferase-related protein 4 [Abeliophyllum distichum]|uniref:Tryptophan aminotransferase-related protein 4 n=1 Tax=Abeliophyllum distichum TaxID=126358 RepID=A0ABD1S8N5_9LAMI
MAKFKGFLFGVFFVGSIALNIFFLTNNLYVGHVNKQQLSWSQRAAAEAEAVASVSCSGHGITYLDGLFLDEKPVCECNSCYGGPTCSHFLPDCVADADSGDPLFLEPFWMQHAESSAVLVAGWHRMSYVFADQSYMSQVLQNHILKVHSIARNAITKGKYLVFGGGSTQLLSAAVFALSLNSSSLARVVAASPYYPVYKTQTDFFETAHFEFQGDAWPFKKGSSTGSSVNAIYDHAYYWPHFTAIPAPADEDVMIFTISKLTGHAGSRFGWALVKDEDWVFEREQDARACQRGQRSPTGRAKNPTKVDTSGPAPAFPRRVLRPTSGRPPPTGPPTEMHERARNRDACRSMALGIRHTQQDLLAIANCVGGAVPECSPELENSARAGNKRGKFPDGGHERARDRAACRSIGLGIRCTLQRRARNCSPFGRRDTLSAEAQKLAARVASGSGAAWLLGARRNEQNVGTETCRVRGNVVGACCCDCRCTANLGGVPRSPANAG